MADTIDSAPIKRFTLVDPAGAQMLLKGFNTTIFTKADVTAATAWTTANSGLTLFTVTGAVLCRIYGVTTTLLTSTSNTGTLAVGITGTTGLFIAATTANGSTNFIANSIWLDNAPTVKGKALPTLSNTLNVALSNANVILTIATNNMTAGAMKLYCDWIPVSPGATVV